MTARRAVDPTPPPPVDGKNAAGTANDTKTRRPETIGDRVHVYTARHPGRTDSPEYLQSHQTLMTQVPGGCVVCDGPVDMAHPGDPKPYKGKLQDHHGGGIYVMSGSKPVLVTINLFPVEWSEGWGADPSVIARLVTNLNTVLRKIGAQQYGKAITDTQGVMDYVDSFWNANVKLCAPHHVGHQSLSSKDANGHEGVGIHNIPFPIWAYQQFCDWSHWDMWGGTTGTIAVAPAGPDPVKDGAQVLHVSPVAKSERKNARAHKALKTAWEDSGHGVDRVVVGPDHNLVRAAIKS